MFSYGIPNAVSILQKAVFFAPLTYYFARLGGRNQGWFEPVITALVNTPEVVNTVRLKNLGDGLSFLAVI